MYKIPLLTSCVAAVFAVAVFANTEPETSKKVGWFEPVERQVEGWTVFVEPALISGEHEEEGAKALKMLANHLQRIVILMPEKQLAELRKVGIWMERSHPELGNMQYHPGKDWLVERGYHPDLVKKVHLPQTKELLSREQMLKHPAVILHELAHAYHDQVLGFDHAGIIEAFEAAEERGDYENVLSIKGGDVKHYAMTDHKEYFAEATEAYFYRNDFFPFVASELKNHDPKAYELMDQTWEARADE